MLPLVAELTGATVTTPGGARQELGQLAGRLDMHFSFVKNDGTPERVLATWVVTGSAGTEVTVQISHERAGRCTATLTL